MPPSHVSLFGKHRIVIEESPAGSGRWFYTISQLSATWFYDAAGFQHVGPFPSVDVALHAGREALSSGVLQQAPTVDADCP